MKLRLPLLLVLLTLLASGCASTKTQPTAAGAESEFASGTGLCASPWGDLPTYTQPGPPALAQMPRGGSQPDYDGSVVVDILVNRDGTVRDVAIVKSSGNDAVDDAALARARAFRYLAKIHPDDPAPYVVPAITIRFSGASGPGQPVSYPFHAN